jgi:hypothetical protein
MALACESGPQKSRIKWLIDEKNGGSKILWHYPFKAQRQTHFQPIQAKSFHFAWWESNVITANLSIFQKLNFNLNAFLCVADIYQYAVMGTHSFIRYRYRYIVSNSRY